MRDRVNTLLLNLKRYSFVGSLVVQPLPSVVSLAWGGFKILLQVSSRKPHLLKKNKFLPTQVAITDMENTTIAMESLESLARVLGHCGIYEKLYCHQGLDASKSLNNSLVDLYVSILEYLCYLKRHLGHNTAGNSSRSRWKRYAN